jgi:hypothetical protein
MPNFNYKAGLMNVGSYQVSGRPFVSGGIDADSAQPAPIEVTFPKVTRWVIIKNNDSLPLKVGFSALGLAGSNYFTVHSGSVSPRLELKLTSVFLTGSSDVDVIAGLTFIGPEAINNGSISAGGPATSATAHSNWTGSAGVG